MMDDEALKQLEDALKVAAKAAKATADESVKATTEATAKAATQLDEALGVADRLTATAEAEASAKASSTNSFRGAQKGSWGVWTSIKKFWKAIKNF